MAITDSSGVSKSRIGGPFLPDFGNSSGAFAATIKQIQENASDVVILVVGDSTGNDITEWVYLFTEWLASQYSTHSVDYYIWNDTLNVYDAAVAVSSGSGAYKISVYNASVGQTRPQYLLGDKYPTAIEAITPSLMIVNHGHNLLPATATTYPEVRSAYYTLIENVKLTHPAISTALLLQNPDRDNNDQETKIVAMRDVAIRRGDISLVDTYDIWIEAGKPSDWYADEVHPSATGSEVIKNSAVYAWSVADGNDTFENYPAWVSETGTPIIANGDFASFAAAVPTGWTVGATATTTKDVGVTVDGHPYSVRLDVASGTNIQFINALTAPNLAIVLGKRVSLCAKMRRAAGSAEADGKVFVDYVVGGQRTTILSRPTTGCNDGWFWNILAGVDIPVTATSVRCGIRGNSTGNASTTYIDRVNLVVGDYPRDV